MGKIRVANFTISIDGFGAGPNQDFNNPLGIRGIDLHRWFLKTKAFQSIHGGAGGVEDVDNSFAEKAFKNVGAWILGRNMFGPVRGQWPNDDWKGWWGPNPPFHGPVFILTHHPRATLKMEGETTFHFVTDGIESTLEQARTAAKDKDIVIGGGVSTIRQYLQAGFIDELHLVIAPILLGSGEHLCSGINLHDLGYACVENAGTSDATHLILKRK